VVFFMQFFLSCQIRFSVSSVLQFVFLLLQICFQYRESIRRRCEGAQTGKMSEAFSFSLHMERLPIMNKVEDSPDKIHLCANCEQCNG
jgi:hypothetical protein